VSGQPEATFLWQADFRCRCDAGSCGISLRRRRIVPQVRVPGAFQFFGYSPQIIDDLIRCEGRLLLRWRSKLAWFLQDVFIANEHGIVEVGLLQARVAAWEAKMPGVKPFLEFLK
jgi:hypothetical protein